MKHTFSMKEVIILILIGHFFVFIANRNILILTYLIFIIGAIGPLYILFVIITNYISKKEEKDYEKNRDY